MPTLDAIRTLTIKASLDGEQEVTAGLGRISDAQDNVVITSDAASKATVNNAAAVDRLAKNLDPAYKAASQLEAQQKLLHAGLANGNLSFDRYSSLLKTATDRAEEFSKSSGKVAEIASLVESRMVHAGASVGLIGEVMQVIGPAGLIAAAGIGAVIVAIDKLAASANDAGEWAKKLTDVSESVNLSTTQLQALTTVASTAGVSSDSFTNGLVRMQREISQLANGTGNLYTQLTGSNTALRNQLSTTTDASKQLNILAAAYANASAAQKKLIEQGFGRGAEGAGFGRVLTQINAQGGVEGTVSANALDNIAADQIKKWDEVKKAIDTATSSAHRNFQSIFTGDVLEGEKLFADGMLSISRSAKEFSLPEDFKTMMGWLGNPATLTVLAALGFVLAATASLPIAIAGGVAAAAIAAGQVVGYVKSKGASDGQDLLTGTQGFKGPNPAYEGGRGDPDNPGSLGVRASDAQKLVSALGSAATAQEKYNAAVLGAQKLAEAEPASRDIANRVIANAGLERATSLQSTYNSALGASATVEDVVALKKDHLLKLQQQNGAITDTVIAKQLEITAAQSLGTFQIDAQTNAEKAKAATFGMTTNAATAYLMVQTKINEAIALGKPLTEDQIQKLRDSANAYLQAKTTADTYADVQKTLQSGATSFTSSLVTGLMAGKSAMSSLHDAAVQLSTTLANKAITDLFSGNWIQAGIEAVGAIGSYIVGANTNSAADESSVDHATAATVASTNASSAERRIANQQAAQTALTDQNTLQGQLAAFDIQSQQARLAEAHKGNGAIVELEQSLAAQRQAIIDKSNTAIAKSMNDFLNSIKTGSLSILSQKDQLAYEQNLFNQQYAGARAGNSSDLNSLTTTASALLTLAQNFYASGTGYADTYKNVTDAISSIAGHPSQSVSADAGITNIADTTAGIGVAGADGVYRTPTGVGYADGGIVGNGAYGLDSVMARYAGGGNIELAGGEHVTKSSSVNANTISALNHINRTGRTPDNDNNSGMMRVLAQGFNGTTKVLGDKLDVIADRVAKLENVTRQTNNQRRVPGVKVS